MSNSGARYVFTFDPLGRRIHKSGTGVTNTWFLNDGDDEVVEYNGNKDVVAMYVPGPAIDEPIAMVTPNGNGTYSRKYFHTNHQGSVIAMSDDAGAKVEGPFTYGPYGSCFQGTTPCAQLTNSVPYKFTSRRLDPETELYCDRARMYWATGGRFLQTDPVGYTADLNLYTYVGNDPGNAADPSGKTALITVRNDTQLNIVIPMLPDNDVSDADVQKVAQNIEHVWTGTFGKYNVTTQVVASRNEGALIKAYGVYNSLHESGLPAGCKGHSCVDPGPPGGGESIYIVMHDLAVSGYGNGDASKGPNTPAHECGHCMGLPDLKGVLKGGIMDDSPGGIAITEQDIENILNSPVNIVNRISPPASKARNEIQNSPVVGSSSAAFGVCSPQKGGCGPGGGADFWGAGAHWWSK